jgi:transcriptional regulator with XRE-family HTH domain
VRLTPFPINSGSKVAIRSKTSAKSRETVAPKLAADSRETTAAADTSLPNVGLRLRYERKSRRMRLTDLASAAGCSESVLSRIENGLVMPSLTTLHRLCRALQISVTSLLQAADEQTCVLYREGERPRYVNGLVEGDSSMTESLVPYADGRLLEAHIIDVPGGGVWCGPYQHAGEEVGYILDGELALKVSEEMHIVRRGDSFFFKSDLEHFYRSNTDQPCRVLWINTPPTF